MQGDNTPKTASATTSRARKRPRVRSNVKAGGSASWNDTGNSPWWGFGGNDSAHS